MLLEAASLGMNNVTPPEHLYRDENGNTEFVSLINVKHDKWGEPSMVEGYTSVTSGSFRSPFEWGGAHALVCKGDALCIFDVDETTTALRNIHASAEMDYLALTDGQGNDVVYYCNGWQVGYVKDRTSWSWTYSGGGTDTRAWSDPPLGNLITFYEGRIYMAQDNLIYHTEAPSYNQFCVSKNAYQADENVLLLRGVDNGIWMGTQHGIWWLSGFPLTRQKKSNQGVISGKPSLGDMSMFSDEGAAPGLLFMGNESVFWGSNDGTLIDLTKNKLTLPVLGEYAGIIYDNRYIVSLT